MDCESFRAWLEDAGPPDKMPEEAAEHLRGCPACRDLLGEEKFWGRFFAAAPGAELSGTLWPGVLAKIRAQEEEALSWDFGLVLMGRRLIPALTLVLLLIGGVASWRGMLYTPPDPDVTAFMKFVEGETGLNGFRNGEAGR
ncbi:hypothetical protein ACFLQ0_02550 [Nitrospinota bacterium]